MTYLNQQGNPAPGTHYRADINFLDCKVLNDHADEQRRVVLAALAARNAWRKEHAQITDVVAKWRSLKVGRAIMAEARGTVHAWRDLRNSAREMNAWYMGQLHASALHKQ